MRPRYLTYNGETKTLSEWSKIVGINRRVLNARFRLGWNIERILNTPVHKPPPPEEKKLKQRIKQKKYDAIYRKIRKEKAWRNTIDKGIEICTVSKYFTRGHRKLCYQQLKKDFEELQQHLKVA